MLEIVSGTEGALIRGLARGLLDSIAGKALEPGLVRCRTASLDEPLGGFVVQLFEVFPHPRMNRAPLDLDNSERSHASKIGMAAMSTMTNVMAEPDCSG